MQAMIRERVLRSTSGGSCSSAVPSGPIPARRAAPTNHYMRAGPQAEQQRIRNFAAAVSAPEAVQAGDDVVIAEFPAPLPGSFAPDRSVFREQHRIRGYEVDPGQRATIVTMANLLQARGRSELESS